ncbi:MAG: hypothetical protein LBI45_02345 [Bacteroidales bacterium]|jgi:hypothetical protein|nr:hypothetical protein [Bacteroidales bacterium]
MIEPTAINLQVFDYYSYNVMRNFVFAEQKPVIQSTYTYEENGVYYCANGTEKGVYRYSYCLNNPLKYVDPTGMIVEYGSGRDKWHSFWLRVFDKQYREDFRELMRSEEIYVLNYNGDGKNHLSTDGNKLYVNYSMTDVAKKAGQSIYSLLKHEFEHSVQFEHGEIGFENKDMGWGTVDRDGNYFEHRKWSAINYDVHDELNAHNKGASGTSWKSGTERSFWSREFVNGEWRDVPKSTQLERLQNTPGYNTLPLGPINNTNTEKEKNYYKYALPYRLRLY